MYGLNIVSLRFKHEKNIASACIQPAIHQRSFTWKKLGFIG